MGQLCDPENSGVTSKRIGLSKLHASCSDNKLRCLRTFLSRRPHGLGRCVCHWVLVLYLSLQTVGGRNVASSFTGTRCCCCCFAIVCLLFSEVASVRLPSQSQFRSMPPPATRWQLSLRSMLKVSTFVELCFSLPRNVSAFAVTFFVTLGVCLYKSLGLLNIRSQAYFACVLRPLMDLYRDVQTVLGWLCQWALAPSWSLVLLLFCLSGSVCGSGDFLFAMGVEGSADFSNRWHPQVQNRRAVPMGTVPWRVAEKPNM